MYRMIYRQPVHLLIFAINLYGCCHNGCIFVTLFEHMEYWSSVDEVQ